MEGTFQTELRKIKKEFGVDIVLLLRDGDSQDYSEEIEQKIDYCFKWIEQEPNLLMAKNFVTFVECAGCKKIIQGFYMNGKTETKRRCQTIKYNIMSDVCGECVQVFHPEYDF